MTQHNYCWPLLFIAVVLGCDSDNRGGQGGELGAPTNGVDSVGADVFLGGVPSFDGVSGYGDTVGSFDGVLTGSSDTASGTLLDALGIDTSQADVSSPAADVQTETPVDIAADTSSPDSEPSPLDSGSAFDTRTPVEDTVLSSPSTGGSGGTPGVHDGYCGLRPYRVFAPAVSGPLPVIIATHGLGDTHLNFANTMNVIGWPAAAAAFGALLVVPAHQNASRPSFVFLKPDNTLDWPNTKVEMDSVLNCVLSTVGSQWDIALNQVYWMGFSEGASFADLAGWALSGAVRGIAPYAGGVGGKTFPIPNPVRVYYVCGTTDYGFQPISAAFQQWVTAGHPAQNVWVSGVGHTFSQLTSQGPSPLSVLQWLAQ